MTARLYYPHSHDAAAARSALSAATDRTLYLTATERHALDAVIAAVATDTAITQTTICAAHDAIYRMRHALPRSANGSDG